MEGSRCGDGVMSGLCGRGRRTWRRRADADLLAGWIPPLVSQCQLRAGIWLEWAAGVAGGNAEGVRSKGGGGER